MSQEEIERYDQIIDCLVDITSALYELNETLKGGEINEKR